MHSACWPPTRLKQERGNLKSEIKKREPETSEMTSQSAIGNRESVTLRLVTHHLSFVTAFLLCTFCFLPSVFSIPIHLSFGSPESSAAVGEPGPRGPSGIEQISLGIFDGVNNALRIEASPGPAGTHTPGNADQVFTSIFDSSNDAIHVECISGCGGATVETNGSMNGSQTVLNLESGAGIVLANPGGTGNVMVSLSGTLPQTQTGQANQWLSSYDAATGAFTAAQPGFSNLSGTVAASQLAVSPVGSDCLQYNGSALVWAGCGGLPGSWTLTGTTNTVLAKPGSGQDAVALEVMPNVASPSADIFQAYLPGATPSTTCAANSKCAFAIQANGNVYMQGNSFTLGSVDQSSASFLFMPGGTPGQSYIELSSAALNPPPAPAVGLAAGGSLPANTQYDVEITYVNSAGETTPSTVTVTAATSSTCASSGNCEIQVTGPGSETNATGYNVYLKTTGGSNYFLQNSSPLAIGANFTMTSENTSSPLAPSANTTGGLYNSFLSMSAEGGGVLCAGSTVPGQDCASGTALVMQAAGMPATGDIVTWAGPHQIGDGGTLAFSGVAGTIAPAQIAPSPVSGDCPQYNGAAMVWFACGAGASWSALTSPAANLSLSMAGSSTTLIWTGGNELNWSSTGNELWQNTTPATASSNQNSPSVALGGTVWNGSASVNDVWTLQDQLGSGSNGQSLLNISHSASAGSNPAIQSNAGFSSVTPSSTSQPNFYANQAAGAGNDFVALWRNGSEYFRVNSTGNITLASAAHLNQAVANQDVAGTITVSTSASSASYSFIQHYGSAPVCMVSPTSNPGSVTWWVTATTTAVTVNTSANPSASLTFNYICIGNPN